MAINHQKLRMPNQRGVTIALMIGSLAILAPIFASIYLSWSQSVAAEKALSLSYAHDVLRRLEETANQFANGMQMANRSGFPWCSPQDIQLLRSIDLGSTYIQGAARVSGNTILCTSQGVTQPVPLGNPSLVSKHGVSEYYQKTLFAGQLHPLDVFAAHGFAIIVDPRMAVDVPIEGPDVELVAYVPSAPDHEPLAFVGHNIQRAWFRSIPQSGEATTLENGYLITHVRSTNWDLAVLTVIPVHYIYGHVSHFALILIPIGVMCGIILGWTVSYIGHIRSSFPALIRSAYRNNELYVEYQPIVDLDTRNVVGAEALVRWRSRSGEVKPDHFIPLAEDHGLIHLITRRVLAIVAADLPWMLKANPHFRVSINVSAADLCAVALNEQLDQLLRVSGASPNNIEIEATERAFLQGHDAVQLISELRQKGFSVAIDDFGTGYSSLSCLQSLSLDTLKIDKTFVETIGTDGPTSQVIPHIIEMGRALNLQLVAEGVESETQAQYLANRGVGYAQGWLFGKPMRFDELLKELEARGIDQRTTLV